MRHLHLSQSCASYPDNSPSDKSFWMLSNHLCFGLPLLLFPGTSIAITLLPTYLSSLLNTCPYHFKLLSSTFLDISPTFPLLILSFLIIFWWVLNKVLVLILKLVSSIFTVVHNTSLKEGLYKIQILCRWY